MSAFAYGASTVPLEGEALAAVVGQGRSTQAHQHVPHLGGDGDEGGHHHGVELLAGVAGDFRGRRGKGAGRTVGAGLEHGGQAVGHGNDAGTKGNGASGTPILPMSWR